MDIVERIKLIRKDKGLSQTAFGERLGVSRSVINNIESKLVEPKEVFIKALILEFDINEKWLRNGIGKMSKTLSDEEKLMELVSELTKDDNAIALKTAMALLTLDEDQLKAIYQLTIVMQKK